MSERDSRRVPTADPEARRIRRISRWWVAIGIVAALILLAAVTPSPYAIERPGPVVNAFGKAASASGGEVKVIRIDGAKRHPTSGALNILSVSITGTPDSPVDWLSLAGTLFDPTRSIVPLDSLYPKGVSAEDRDKQNEAMMLASQQSAIAAALKQHGDPVGEHLRVAGVSADGPAEGELRTDDLIRDADGAKISRLDDLKKVIAAAAPGDAIRLGIERSGERIERSVVPETAADGTRLLGITVSEEYSFPFEVEVELDNIGGPSAGLVFALAIYDELTPGELTGGREISGTGTIDADGDVGPIGGLPQKIWGASLAGSSLMLIPTENCADVPDRIPDGMRLVPVSTLDEAVSALETVDRGEAPPGLERCSAAEARDGS